jgi:GTP cyclohydrolase I
LTDKPAETESSKRMTAAHDLPSRSLAADHLDSLVITPGTIRVQEAVRKILSATGEDPERQGLIDTPKRVAKMYGELLSGYTADPAGVLSGALFEVEYDEMFVVKRIGFHSLCEHHMLPFSGVAGVGYLPDGKAVGLSKIPRLVDMFARKFQVQERLTQQIAHTISTLVQPTGVGVVLEASHMCSIMRGVRKSNAVMVTRSVLGAFRTDGATRDEFLPHVRGS